MLRGSFVVPSLTRTCPFLSLFVKIHSSPCHTSRALLGYRTCFPGKPINVINCNFLMNGRAHLCSLPLSAKSPIRESSPRAHVSNKSKKKERREAPEAVLKFKLDMCSRHRKLIEALQLYDEARGNGVQLNVHHYNVVLYLCSCHDSSAELSEDPSDLGLKRGFKIFQQMLSEKVAPNEATFTSVARLAAAMNDPEMAFDLVKQMKQCGIPPKLRSYEPALLGFCEKGEADKAYAVDAHMAGSGLMAEEPELCALLKVSVETKKADKVYELLHRLRATVRQVTESTVGIIEDWFKSGTASEIGMEKWDVNLVKEGVIKGGGGWHGQGWLGSGRMRVEKTVMNEKGVCQSCGEKLVCIDIDPKETENFASSLISLACKREVKGDFIQFQKWLQQHGPFDAVIDGANVGLANQSTFSFNQIENVVNLIREMIPSKRSPLIILHRSRVTGGPAQHPKNQRRLETWTRAGALYSTPLGSNDDWYWLYAAVSCNCLLVTNDEMRDHLFQLLGSTIFPRWKEKHQVHMSVSRMGVSLHMPPPYSIVIQESENGSWHVPTTTGDDIENPRQWLCARRTRSS
ncbi:proteinaceous RNase P 1 chloroplastic/mitochondrial-like [Tripterygium wilfordii]|uniref:ribonuclease P n=1 Tax=Tripterygium wilfordii TaxID=458696 RepID=A0A7J7DC30_TRIWF|nr:proteinaceous RNase P 1, chloroplastic/mitochondrial [Tripterygium wilfordii]XP_038709690.1 proteinaceous RNase P 1, chloroplastic/mitochondrial [Tripterygium wilfordii]KAF5743945.1 proteinaceous RNase P 1 chloroplastic/mitochondrial-like [Tripterygium wilfordii]